jgi:Cytochrome c554 and c-prime
VFPSILGIMLARHWKSLICLSMSFGGVLPAQQKPYLGAGACGKCHPAQLALQSDSAHAHALSRPAQHPLAARFAPEEELLRPPRYHFQVRWNGPELRVRAFDNDAAVELPVDWAFGAGGQAVTFVSRVDKDWYLEHYLTYYSASRRLEPTPGQTGLRSNTLALAMGYLYPSTNPVTGVIKCFQCHSTGPPSIGSENRIQPAELGVRCEACHGPGSAHAAAVSKGQTGAARTLIRNPKRMTAAELNQFCGECHRTPASGPTMNVYKAWNVRHQPIYLSRSKCFLASRGRLSCLTCHDPHQKLDRDATHYNQKCARCHETARHPAAAGYAVASSPNCIECHMPRVPAQERLEFTNHWIGVYAADANLAPRQ